MRIDERFGARAAIAALIVAGAMTAGAPAAPLSTAAPMALSMDIDFLWSPNADNDTQIYLHVSNEAWEPSRSQVKKVFPRMRHTEYEYPILVFMAHESHRSLSAVWEMRAGGMSWAVIMGNLRIPRERLVIELEEDHKGPPRGKAHGYWRNHASARRALTDDDIYYWVNVHTMARYFERDPAIIAARSAEGGTFKSMAAKSFRAGRGKAKKFKGKKVQAAGTEHRQEEAAPPVQKQRPKRRGQGNK